MNELQDELSKVFGRLTKWKYLCKEADASSEEDKAIMAERVISEPCSGTVAEALIYSLKLQGAKSIAIDEFNKIH